MPARELQMAAPHAAHRDEGRGGEAGQQVQAGRQQQLQRRAVQRPPLRRQHQRQQRPHRVHTCGRVCSPVRFDVSSIDGQVCSAPKTSMPGTS